MPDTKKIELRPRKCRFCTQKFTPERAQDRDSTFCSKLCRTSFYQGGTKNYQRLMQLLTQELIREIHETAYHRIMTDRISELRVEINEAVDASIKRYYSPDRIAELLAADGEGPVMAAINKVAKAAAENAFKALVPEVQNSGEPKEGESNGSHV